MEFYDQGYIKPICPFKEFEATEVEQAYRYMQKGTHIGKIVMKMPESPGALQLTAGKSKLSLRPDVSYLLVGGLGGLGRTIAIWMAEHGARHITFMSRSAGQQREHDLVVRELEALGCNATLFSGSVSEVADVRRLVESCDMPIAGVIQASMVLRVSGRLPVVSGRTH